MAPSSRGGGVRARWERCAADRPGASSAKEFMAFTPRQSDEWPRSPGAQRLQGSITAITSRSQTGCRRQRRGKIFVSGSALSREGKKCRGVRQGMAGPLPCVGREVAAQHPAKGSGTRCPQPGCPTPPAHGASGGAHPSGWDLGRLCRRSYKGADFPTDASIAALRKCVSRAGPPASRCFGERAGTAHTVFNN